MIDLNDSCRRTAEVLRNVRDDQLGAPTPCAAMSVRDLVAHIGELAKAFAAAAGKDLGPLTDTPPEPGAQLEPDWRTAYPAYLAALAEAWRHPVAWTGMTRAGGVDLPGQVAGSVALAEVVIHGWDAARATDQPYGVDAATSLACLTHLAQFDASGTEGLFGPAVPVPDDAPALDRIVALSGRDPQWSA
ncbi:MAG: TIGR03086 family protein [Mycobacterium sp.]|nr:TIGR03086 family protein [Mycobacterium sp.]